MPIFTIETTYRIPVYRQRTYEADTLDQACQLAVSDDDWSDGKKDYESAGETIVTGIWDGADAAYRAPGLPIPEAYAGPRLIGADDANAGGPGHAANR